MPTPTENPRAVVVERELPHSPAKVWRALTEGALLEEWLMKNDFMPIVGHRFSLRAPANAQWDGIVACEVIEVVSHQRLAYRWNAFGGLETIVTWTITPTKTGVVLRMEQAGTWPEERNLRGAEYGWQKMLFPALEKLLAAQNEEAE